MKIAFAGTPEVAATVLKSLAAEHEISLVLTRPDAPKGRSRENTPSPVAEMAQDLGLPVIKSTRVDTAVIDKLKASNAELVVVVAYGALIAKEALSTMQWLNLHFSLLPLWRGATPLQHSMIYGTGQGITLFQIDEGLDTGPVVAQLPLTLEKGKTAGELLDDLAKIGSELIIRSLKSPLRVNPQVGESTRAPKISRADAKLSFELPASNIEARVLAFNPEPTAWCQVGSGELRILRARAIGNFDWDALSQTELETGSLEIRKDSVLVVCGSGSRLELIEVQPSGKKPMSAVDWARGYSGSKIG
jgi:methionyl-tRNA formyltransferase